MADEVKKFSATGPKNDRNIKKQTDGSVNLKERSII